MTELQVEQEEQVSLSMHVVAINYLKSYKAL